VAVETNYIFASYARSDVESVRPIVDAIREEFQSRDLDVSIWLDIEELRAGERWDHQIEAVLRQCIGLLVFVSPASMQSDWVRRELKVTIERQDRLVLPIILQQTQLPKELELIQWIDPNDAPNLHEVAVRVATATEHYLNSHPTRPAVSAAEAPTIAAQIAQDTRESSKAGVADTAVPDSVFIVYGHHTASLNEVEDYLQSLGVKTVVLSKIGGAAQSLIQKFLSFSTSARFAIVILSADDLGASRIQYETPNVADRALQFRARQNVVLELGFFYGHLGWEQVFVLYRSPDQVFPNFERPSDLDGVVFDTIDESGRWRNALAERLLKAGFRIQASQS
jgi:predicted nucleotide-binding protein